MQAVCFMDQGVDLLTLLFAFITQTYRQSRRHAQHRIPF